MKEEDIKSFLEEKYLLYNNRDFIDTDPIQIPHRFVKRQDIEISGLLTATIAWGQRKSIITNATRLVKLMDNAPYDFVKEHSENDLRTFKTFVHRTFNGEDCIYFIRALRFLYAKSDSIEPYFSSAMKDTDNVLKGICDFRNTFLALPHEHRMEKHVSDPCNNSSAKRFCMYLRWMVRKDNSGVDFGLWKKIKPSQLCLPLDLHTGNTARKLGLLKRKQNDRKAVEEITEVLIAFDNKDPIKYDFALFGLGAFEKF